jgi:hypothetical protein
VADKFDFHKLSADLSDIQDKKLRKHIENAVKFTRKREPVLQANSSRTSSRPECAQCGVGIRKETTPVNGMHPKCAKVASDASFAAQMPISSHAARSVHDRKILPTLRDDAEKRAHAAMLAKFEAAEQDIEENSAS